MKYLQTELILGKNNGSFFNIDGDGNVGEPIRLVNNAFDYAFSLATFSTIGDKGIE